MIDLRGCNVLVTGASKGIGAACARLMGGLGASVAVHFHQDASGAEHVASAIVAAGATAVPVQADLRRWQEAERLVGCAASAIGTIDVLVANHGIWEGAPIDRMSERQYDETMDTNLRSYMALAGAAARRMKLAHRGRIVLIASTAGQRGEAFHSHYAASKGAVISLTKSLAAELASDGILVNCVAPGWVDTQMSASTMADEAARASVLQTIPLRRIGTPDEIAWPVAFLCSAGATFITGEILNVNGGAVLVG